MRHAALLILVLAVPAVGAAGPHWAFQPVKRPAGNSIDAFVSAKLKEKGLALSPEADRRTLIRRLKFDLLGLPPTPEEVEAFVNDKDANAYDKLVDRYLASPHYGERWARHWLDCVRFAESHGFEMNQPRSNAYHYRDYVIRSLNDDKPYDQFIREQLAGDALGADAATGFLVAGAWDQVKSPDPVLTANQRADELHDIVGTTASTFLGLTVACARCHDHKFDPIPQLDYYQFKAVFAGVQHGERLVRNEGSEAERKARGEKLKAELAGVEAKLAALDPLADPAATEARRPPVSARGNVERFKPTKARFVRFVIFQTTDAEPCIDELAVYTAGKEPANVALKAGGAKATSSGDLPGFSDKHRLEFVNDGVTGNNRSWISGTKGRGWVCIEFSEPATVDRVEWARDRDGVFPDRLATRYRIDLSVDGEAWNVVASSDDRAAYDLKTIGVRVAPPALTPAQRTAWLNHAQAAGELSIRLGELTRGAMAYVGRMTVPEATFRLHRGDATKPREAVAAGGLSEVGPKLTIPADATDPQRRLALAKWIASAENPLTARVLVNRLWHHHFGAGIVDTPSDFGLNGGKPTHPELLDFLAAELIDPTPPAPLPAGRGEKEPSRADKPNDAPMSVSPLPAGRGAGGVGSSWSLKHIHRLIVTSATYKQSSAANPAGLAADAQSRLLWRYPPRRAEAEALRDAVLFVSGALDTTMGGPGFDLFEPNTNYVRVFTPKKEFGRAEFRRMVYQHKPRMQLDDTFGAFDCPDAGQIAPRRNVSITPLQALNLLNSRFVLQQADTFAARVEKDAGKDTAARVKRAFALAFQRPPGDRELAAATKLVADHGLPALCRALLNANEFVFVD